MSGIDTGKDADVAEVTVLADGSKDDIGFGFDEGPAADPFARASYEGIKFTTKTRFELGGTLGEYEATGIYEVDQSEVLIRADKLMVSLEDDGAEVPASGVVAQGSSADSKVVAA